MTFPIQSLYRFPTRTRTDIPGYNQPFDPGRRVKTWVDPAAANPSTTFSYRVFNPAARTEDEVFIDLTLSGHEAATYNLPGAVTYPPYVVAPTGTRRAGGLINPIYLSLESEAVNLMNQLDGHSLAQEGQDIFPVVYPPDEPRRLWAFMWNGRQHNVGALLFNRNKVGIGAPGHWDLNGLDPKWVPDPPPPSGPTEIASGDVVPIPVRDLLPDEHLVRTMFGWEIQKGEAPISGIGGGISAEQFAQLYSLTAETNEMLKQLLTALRIA